MSRNTADYRCAECGASIPFVSGLCAGCVAANDAWFVDDESASACPDCGCWASRGDTCEGDGGCECHAYEPEDEQQHDDREPGNAP